MIELHHDLSLEKEEARSLLIVAALEGLNSNPSGAAVHLGISPLKDVAKVTLRNRRDKKGDRRRQEERKPGRG